VLSVLIPSIITLFVPMACRTSFGLALFIRCVIGFFESATFPAVYHFFPIWVPLPEKTLMIPAIISGMYLGEIIGFSLSGILISWDITINGQSWGGWQVIFYIFGLCGVLWFPYWALFAYESPDKHPKITKEELDYIREGKGYTSLKTMEDDGRYSSLLFYDHDAENRSEHKMRPFQATDNTMTTTTTNNNPMSPTREEDFQHSYNSPVFDDNNPMARFNDQEGHSYNPMAATGEGDVTEIIPEVHFQQTANRRASHGGDHSNQSQQLLLQQQHHQTHRTASMLSEPEDREELAKRIPWKNFFTHPVSLTFFINGWAFVRFFKTYFSLKQLFSSLFSLGFH
jgi:hypothetical protein